MTTGAFIIARLSSSRLPAKNIMPINGRPMIDYLVERIRRARSIDEIVVTTSDERSDDPLAEWAANADVGCYRGPLQDIMARLCGAARAYDCDTVVEILGDNPLVDPEMIDEVVELQTRNDFDCAVSITDEYNVKREDLALFALGVRVQAFKLEAAERYIDFPDYIRDDIPEAEFLFVPENGFKTGFIEATGHWQKLHRPEINFAVNYLKNFQFLEQIISGLYPDKPDFSLPELMAYLEQKPNLLSLLGAE
ncbi:MAG: hypothetical protein CMF67_07140 [Magnetovibrio sp.]|nr:hypothetical protein [Magnetovibrio sp.]|tara:strand:- start:467 stop:1219 length:753 start_codon:yes stop_codon:yes gene_type:complete